MRAVSLFAKIFSAVLNDLLPCTAPCYQSIIFFKHWSIHYYSSTYIDADGGRRCASISSVQRVVPVKAVALRGWVTTRVATVGLDRPVKRSYIVHIKNMDSVMHGHCHLSSGTSKKKTSQLYNFKGDESRACTVSIKSRVFESSDSWEWMIVFYTVSQKTAQLWNNIARNYMDRFWWYLAEIFKSL